MSTLTERYLDPDEKLLDPSHREIEPSEGDRGWAMAGHVRAASIDRDRRRLHATLSDPTEDRYGEVVEPKGCLDFLTRFNSAPTLLADHNHDVQIGHWEDMKADKAFHGWAVFANDPAVPKAAEHWALYAGGHRHAFSVGFIGHKYEMRKSADGNGHYRAWTIWEPVEGSSVSVPANPNALANSLRSSKRSVAVAWADTPEELAAFYQKITQVVGEEVARQIANTTPGEIEKQLEVFSQGLDARLPGWIADAIDLRAGREAHERLFDDSGLVGPSDGNTPSGDGDALSPETIKAIAALSAKLAPRN